MKKSAFFVTVCILIAFSLTIFFITKIDKSQIITRDGYFISGNRLDEVLLNENKLAKSENLNLEKVNDSDIFYVNLNKTYVGEEKKIEVNTMYPMYINNGLGIVNMDTKSKLINNKFEIFDTYLNFTVTGGKVYNYGDFEQADYEKYIVMLLSNSTYVNLYENTIKTNGGEYKIPVNSIVNYQEEFMNYYYFDSKGKLVYKIIDGLSLENEILFGDNKYTYEDFLVGLGKIDKKEVEEEEKVEEEVIEDEYIIEIKDDNNNQEEKPTKYVAPKVSATNFEANVYSAKARLSISDPSRVIVGGINFQFYVNDKVYIRKTFIDSGNVEIIGLVPNTKFKVVGSYKYYNENKKKMEMTFFEQELTTLGVDTLEPIELAFNNGNIYPTKIEIKDLKITSDLRSETIKGVNKAIVLINGEQYSIPTGSLREMINGHDVVYLSPAKVNSNTIVNYVIKLLDSYGNEIKVTNNTGTTRTSKNAPIATVKVASSAVNEVALNIVLKNVDDVNINNFRYIVYDSLGNIVQEKSLDSKLSSQVVSLRNLDPNATYNVVVLGNYDIESGEGTLLNQVMGEGKFTTAPLSSLGFFRVLATTNNLTHESATLVSNLDIVNVSSILIELLDSLNITITDSDDNIVYTKTYTNGELNSIRAGDEFNIDLENLNSMSVYNINYNARVKQGTVVESINVLCSLKNFRTYKTEAKVDIRNEFVTSSMIDFDVRVVDLDGAIESGRVLLEIRDSKNNLVAKEYLDINADYLQLSYNKLNPDETYTFTYIAEEYNKGFTNATYEGDYKLLERKIVTEDGISGNIELIDLLRDITGTNLFNLEDYNRIRKEGYTGYKEYDIKNNTVMFGAKNGYVNYSYFLPEAKGKIVTLSFRARYNKESPNKAPVYIALGYGNTLSFKVDNITDEYKYYYYTFESTSNYIGFNINETTSVNMKTTVDFKDIQIVYTDEKDFSRSDVSLSIHPSKSLFSETKMIDGNSSMPDWRTTGTVIGNAGPGHARITRLSDNKVYEFSYTGSSQTFTVPSNGIYKVECWGAAGGDNQNPVGNNRTMSSRAGRGAYTSGTITLEANKNLYVYVGGAGTYGTGTKAGGWNGGGTNGNSKSNASGSGGGATDIRLVSGAWNNLESLQSRIMVAGAGGGADNAGGTVNGSDDGRGGSGGALFGENTYISGVITPNTNGMPIFGAGFGVGGSPTSVTDTGGGGSGYYGGRPSNNGNGGGGGGSSYISGHAGCISYNNIENFLKYTAYTENPEYQGRFNINMYDVRDEIPTKDFYVRLYRKGEFVKEYCYDLDGNSVENFVKTYGFDKNVKYTVTLSVKIRDRYYDIDSIEFTTETEIRAIRTTAEFFAMHPDGKYIVLNDLDFRNSSTAYTSWFYGEIDFQGYHMLRNVQGAGSRIFEQFRSSAVIKNLVIDMWLDNPSGREWYYGLITYNYGTVDNVMVNVHEATEAPNYVFTLIAYANYGRIQNFVINSEASVSALAAVGLATWSNQGVLRNGYVYGENIYAYHQNVDRRSRKDVAPLAGETTNNSRIENVYSLITVEKNNSYGTGDKELSVGNLVGYHGAGYIGNAYSVEFDDKNNTNVVSRDVNIGTVGGIRKNELYYSSDLTYAGTRSAKVSKLALYDSTFQNQVLNTYNGFEVDKYVDLGYFPQVKLNDCMPNQDWLELPKVTDTDLVDVTSVELMESSADSATVKLHINNPSNETISKITITDINKVEILNQKNSFGKTELTVKLSEPKSYKSKYFIDTLWIKTAYGLTYTKSYEKNERSINVDLYYPINSRNDWKIMVSNPSQNYALMTDIDFKDVASISEYVVNSTFSAKFDGRGHTISNITIGSNNGMFNTFTGTLKNLNVKNYKKTNSTSYGGFIYSATTNAVIDNVHIVGSQIYARDRVGGLVGNADNITIRNSSVTGFKPTLPNEQENSYVGGIVGYSNLVFIENCFVSDVDIDITYALSMQGVGGIAGRMSQGTIQNSYATGKIKTTTINVGGLVGWSTATISNVWSYVDIDTNLDYVGGIVGRTDNSNIRNSLSLGAVYSTFVSENGASGNNVHRTSGNPQQVIQQNYAWNKQKFYGYVTGESSTEVLLTKEELKELTTYTDLIGFEGGFDYSQIEDYILPKVINSDTEELLPNQKDITFIEEEFDLTQDIGVDQDASRADIHISISNPNQYEITGVEFDYLKILTQRYVNNSDDGTTDIYLSVSPNYCFDSYTLTKVIYNDLDNNKQTYDKTVKVPLQFYKTLSSYDDWTHVSKTYAENYRLTGDIDFEGKNNINTGVVFGRLEGLITDSGTRYSIKNYTKTNITASKTNLIRKVTTTLKNVDFDNITLTTAEKTYSYINVIYLNYADIDDVNFNNIRLTSTLSNYVAPIAENRAQNVKNVTVNHNYSKGASYVSTFISHSYNLAMNDISAYDCTVYGSNQYIGALIGNRDYLNDANTFRLTGDHLNVTGKTDVGGLFGYGGSRYAKITNSTITGINGGNYVGGIAGRSSFENEYYNEVIDCTIIADSNYVGGMYGWARHLYNSYVKGTTVTQTNAARTYVGGAFGYQDGYTHSDIGVVDVTVTSAGDYVGGYSGRLNGGANFTYSYLNNVTVQGRNYVGGITGTANTARVYQTVVNVNVTGTGNYVGGAFGYLASIHETDSAYSAVVYECLIANSKVKGNNYVGGFVGNTNNNQITPKKFYNIIVVADVEATATSDIYVGAINGRDNKNYSKVMITTVKLYENNLLNGKTVKSSGLTNLTSTNFATSTNLITKSYYTGFGFAEARWDYSNIATSFPKVRFASGTGNAPRAQQKQIKVPTGAIVFGRLYRESAPIGHELPNMNLYSSGVNTINLEFDNTDPYTFFEVYDLETKVFESNIDQRTYSLYYDYQSDIKVVVSDMRNTKVYKFKAGEIRNTSSTYKKKYAYIYEGKLKGNIDKVNTKGKFIHIYNNLALTSELEVVDILTGSVVDDSYYFTISLVDQVVPLYTFDYNDTVINTFYNYSIIKQNGDDLYYENQILVKDGNVEIVDNLLDSKHNMVIVDKYSKNNYVTTLGNDGVLYDLKTPIAIPINFSNKGILSITHNLYSNSSAIILTYKSGKVVVFDYRTGREIETEKAIEDISIIEYFKQNIKREDLLIRNDIGTDYQETLNLKNLLSNNPIDINSNGEFSVSDNSDTNTNITTTHNSRNYVTYYNSVTDNYDIVDVSNILTKDENQINVEKIEVVSEKNKIYSSNSLVEFYMKKSVFKEIFENINGLYIFGFLFMGLLTALFIGSRYTKKLKPIEEE